MLLHAIMDLHYIFVIMNNFNLHHVIIYDFIIQVKYTLWTKSLQGKLKRHTLSKLHI